jgi:KipI family sensor histidine kinase inhibitor
MTLKPLGDSAWLVEFAEKSSPAVLAQVMGWVDAMAENRPHGVLDVVPSFASLAVHFEGDCGLEILEWIRSIKTVDRVATGEERQIPVCYDGPDLAEIAERTGMSPEAVIALHSSVIYTVAAVGFSPGFPYLLGLPGQLALPRRATPRQSVPAGSVAMAGGQTGIYPFASPGGWQILGRTSARLFDPSAERPAWFQAGDRVRFVPVETLPAEKGISSNCEITAPRWFEVIQPGALTTVQDLGRQGYESSGVSPGGAVDRHALRMANLLVGNDEGAAALEICLSGPVLKFHAETVVALVGATGRPQRVAAGETLDFSKLTGGVRACLAVAGGIQVPRVLGSMATDLRAAFGGFAGRALRAGDLLTFGESNPSPRIGDWHVGRAENPSPIELRFIPGIQQHWFREAARQRFTHESYQLTARSDRMGARLAGPKLLLAEPREMASQAVACGSVQVPPDGQPIILLAERQTIGGYPQIGHIVSVDLPKLARAWPGTAVSFREVTWEEARKLKREHEIDFKRLQTGLDLLI